MAPITDEKGGMLFLMPDIPWIEAFVSFVLCFFFLF